MGRPNPWGLSYHLPFLLVMQVIFIILFALFARYDPKSAYKSKFDGDFGNHGENSRKMMQKIYPMFQDVHVMIFIGFGFLMTFLKRYGLSAVSLNMLISAFAIQWTILVSGFFHFHYDECPEKNGTMQEIHKRSADSHGGSHSHSHYNLNCYPNWPWIDINVQTLINADFAVAAVLISFGAVIGVTSPIQLLVMALIEIVLFNINEIIGRNYIGALDAGDTIFVHLFGAYFGLALSRVIYDDNSVSSDKAGSSRLSDLFSMIGTVFLWMYWPSFNAGAAATGDAQQRAVINTYLALCAACCSAFAVSALVNHERKFVMEHIQNATLAGGVAVGAVADMILTPFGALVMGTIAGSWSTIGYEFISPLLVKRKITDTCGVHNLHGMPAVMGGLLSVLLAAAASPRKYDQFNSGELRSLHEIFPLAAEQDWSRNHQAWLQFAAMLVTMAFALIGGSLTGFVLKFIGKHQMKYKPGHTVMKLALNIGNVLAPHNVPQDKLYDDDLYFAREEDEEDPRPQVVNNGISSKDIFPETQTPVMSKPNPWGLSYHIPVLIIMQFIFIVLFGLFTRYDPGSAYRNEYDGDFGHGIENSHNMTLKIYPMFQDVHVMIFIGFGFLMTFLKRYGLSAISLNMLISAFAIQWTILVSGFFHLHYDKCPEESDLELHKRAADADHEALYNAECNPNWPWIDINIQTLINADFAVAAVLISFGAVIGVTSPIQLLVMALIEIVLFNINEIIGRNYIGALDAGDTIFVHLFGAYFGLALSRVIYDDNSVSSDKAGSSRLSDLFSMIGTVFLWMYWPSFNAGAAATGDAQQRAVINTYLALCAACCSAFAVSALVNHERKFVMEHIQNATLAGGVAVGAVADMILTPFGSLIMGVIAGSLSTLGYEFVSPFLVKKLKITDTCGVHNLHGMPAVLGGILSILLAGIAMPEEYDQFNSGSDKSLHEIFPLSNPSDSYNEDTYIWTSNKQAWFQAAAMLVTMGFALVGGTFTGFILKYIGKHQMKYKMGHTIMKLALNIGNVLAPHNVPKDKMYDDDLYFANEEAEEEEEIHGVDNKGYYP